MTVDPDAHLAAAGDMEAFETIYRRYSRRVYSLCLRMLRNTTDAEDLTQEIFVQLFRKIHTFRGDASFTTWLHRLAVNQVLMHVRKPMVKRENTTAQGAIPIRIVTGTGNPRRMAVVDRIALDQAMGQLAPGYRLIFTLHDIEGYEHCEIAKMLGCAVGTSKSQLHKARLKLRQLLLGLPPHPDNCRRDESKSGNLVGSVRSGETDRVSGNNLAPRAVYRAERTRGRVQGWPAREVESASELSAL